MAADNKIFLTDEYIVDEGEADAAITPGHLIEYDTTTDLFIPHGTDAGVTQARFARKNPTADTAAGTAPIDDPYADGDHVWAAIARRGCRVNALVQASENIAIGDVLVSAGDGALREYVSGTDAAHAPVAVAREAGTDASDFRIEVEVL